MDQHNNTASLYLPDLCRLPGVFVTVLIGELIAIVLTLGPLDPAADRWHAFSLMSLYIQWLGLSGAVLLCLLRGRLARLTAPLAGTLAYAVLLGVTALLSEVAFRALTTLELTTGADQVDHIGFVLRTLIICAVLYAFALRYLYVLHEWRRNTQAEANARLAALQARIRPHFLFNTMNTIASLIHPRPDQAEEAVENLAELMRASLAPANGVQSLADELALCRHYLELEQMRLGDRLQIAWEETGRVDHHLPLPSLLLQPLLENAVYHGIEPRAEGGCIALRLNQDARELTLQVENPLPAQERSRTGHRLAQDNIRQRLDLAYDGRARLEITQTADSYRVTIGVPLRP